MTEPATTDGSLLGGRLRYRQPRAGYRTGIEPVLLAASIAARPGARILEGGTGAGAGLLCLAARVPGISGIGVEVEPEMAGLAQGNFVANGFSDIICQCRDVLALAPPGRADGAFDHAFANPPWHAASGTQPADPLRRRAKTAPTGLITAWIGALGRQLRHRGTLTLILPARALPEALGTLGDHGLGSPVLCPLWPRPGQPARLFILQAQRGGRGDCVILPGLVLHAETGYAAQAAAILTGGAPLDLTRPA